MPKISSYIQPLFLSLTDKLLGTDTSASNITKNFELGNVLELFNSASVPDTLTSTGTKGQLAADETHLYVCVNLSSYLCTLRTHSI